MSSDHAHAFSADHARAFYIVAGPRSNNTKVNVSIFCFRVFEQVFFLLRLLPCFPSASCRSAARLILPWQIQRRPHVGSFVHAASWRVRRAPLRYCLASGACLKPGHQRTPPFADVVTGPTARKEEWTPQSLASPEPKARGDLTPEHGAGLSTFLAEAI